MGFSSRRHWAECAGQAQSRLVCEGFRGVRDWDSKAFMHVLRFGYKRNLSPLPRRPKGFEFMVMLLAKMVESAASCSVPCNPPPKACTV